MTTSLLARRLRGTVLPAVLTPLRADGTLERAALERYAARMTAEAVGGVAVWAHTGRGPYLSAADRDTVLRVWRAATGAPVIAGAGVPRDAQGSTLDGAADATVRMAERAAALGADAVMVFPLAGLAGLPDGDERAVRLHERVHAACGLPVLGFLLHGEAGGYPYPPALVRDLLALPGTLGIKLATLNAAIDCQDAIRAGEGSGKLLVTGEDRMFGPSLMWGADTALVGVAAARAGLTTAVLQAWNAGDHTAFVRASGRLDRFARAVFRAPIEGYVQRMLWAAVGDGLLPEESAHDPYGPPLPRAERAAVQVCLEKLGEHDDGRGPAGS